MVMLVNDDCFGVVLCCSYDVHKSFARGVQRRSCPARKKKVSTIPPNMSRCLGKMSRSPMMYVTVWNNMSLMLRKKWSCLSTMTATVSSYAVAMMCKNPSLWVCGEEVCPARKEKVCTFPPNMSRLLRQERSARRRWPWLCATICCSC